MAVEFKAVIAAGVVIAVHFECLGGCGCDEEDDEDDGYRYVDVYGG